MTQRAPSTSSCRRSRASPASRRPSQPLRSSVVAEGDCQNVQAWLAVKARFESRFTLSADLAAERGLCAEAPERERGREWVLGGRGYEHWRKQRCEKRLTQALVNKRSHQALQQDDPARVGRSQGAHIGIRDYGAVGGISALKERTCPERGPETTKRPETHRRESSESILMDARKRIDALNRTVGEPPARRTTSRNSRACWKRSSTTTTRSKHDNAEVNPLPPRSATTPAHLKQHFHTCSLPSAMLSPTYSFKRSSSNERRSSRRCEPLTPETNRRPWSPTDSLANSDTKRSAFSQPQGRLPGSQSQTYFGDANDVPEECRQHKSLLLLSCSRGVHGPDRQPTHTRAVPAIAFAFVHAPDGDEADEMPMKGVAAPLESGSVLQALTRRVQSFRNGLSGDSIVAQPVETQRTSGTASLSGSEMGTSPPKPTAPVAIRVSRRS
uniref:Uncharacterized protein n=1 Tax=Mycena chlorophos TaxID=658473 RepID=A0ABQ0KUS5_MYCCL|nr:predicted protein [Mycena chlorophos]